MWLTTAFVVHSIFSAVDCASQIEPVNIHKFVLETLEELVRLQLQETLNPQLSLIAAAFIWVCRKVAALSSSGRSTLASWNPLIASPLQPSLHASTTQNCFPCTPASFYDLMACKVRGLWR
jgi:hypothetical protein